MGVPATEQRQQDFAGDELARLGDRHHPVGVAVEDAPVETGSETANGTTTTTNSSW